MNLLTDKGANINHQYSTAYCICRKSIESSGIIKRKADQTIKNKNNTTPLNMDNCFKISANHIWHTSADGSLKEFEFCFNEDPTNLNKQDNLGKNPLHLASVNSHSHIVEFLLSKETTIDALDYLGNTPLILTSFHGHCSVIDLLLNAKINTNHKN